MVCIQAKRKSWYYFDPVSHPNYSSNGLCIFFNFSWRAQMSPKLGRCIRRIYFTWALRRERWAFEDELSALVISSQITIPRRSVWSRTTLFSIEEYWRYSVDRVGRYYELRWIILSFHVSTSSSQLCSLTCFILLCENSCNDDSRLLIITYSINISYILEI